MPIEKDTVVPLRDAHIELASDGRQLTVMFEDHRDELNCAEFQLNMEELDDLIGALAVQRTLMKRG